MSSTNLILPPVPDLRIVPIDSVLPHEEHDAQRSGPLIERIRTADFWTNPPIVAQIEKEAAEDGSDARYALLDGRNRHYCASALGFPYILVQVVDYYSPHVTLETWNHVLSHVKPDEFLPELYKIDGLHVEHSDVLTARAALARREAIAYIRVLPDWILMLMADSEDVASRTAALRAMVNTYKIRARLDRVNHDQVQLINQVYPDAAALVVFPRYEPAEIIVAARDRIFLPPGISRHIIQGRAMRLHYPIDALKTSDESASAKNAKLLGWIQERFAQKSVRFYQEAMYVFDD